MPGMEGNWMFAGERRVWRHVKCHISPAGGSVHGLIDVTSSLPAYPKTPRLNHPDAYRITPVDSIDQAFDRQQPSSHSRHQPVQTDHYEFVHFGTRAWQGIRGKSVVSAF